MPPPDKPRHHRGYRREQIPARGGDLRVSHRVADTDKVDATRQKQRAERVAQIVPHTVAWDRRPVRVPPERPPALSLVRLSALALDVHRTSEQNRAPY